MSVSRLLGKERTTVHSAHALESNSTSYIKAFTSVNDGGPYRVSKVRGLKIF